MNVPSFSLEPYRAGGIVQVFDPSATSPRHYDACCFAGSHSNLPVQDGAVFSHGVRLVIFCFAADLFCPDGKP